MFGLHTVLGAQAGIDPAALGPIVIIGGIALVFYFYNAICFMTIAKKTNTPNGWMAWIPPLIPFLMASIGRRSMGWAIAAFIPCIQIIALPILFGGVAEARGMSSATGLLIFVPIINFFLPMILASGAPTNPGGGAPGQPAASAGPRSCAKCGLRLAPGDVFCGSCGTPAPRPTPTNAPAPAPAKGGGMAIALLGVVALGMLVCCGVGGYFAFNVPSYQAPVQQPPNLPPRMAGTRTVLPLDTEPIPAQPTGVISQTFPRGPDGGFNGTVNVPPEQLPPGLPPEELPNVSTAATSAVYRTNPTDPPVNVSVLNTGGYPGTYVNVVDRVAGGMSGVQPTGIQVQSPQGQSFQGARFENGSILVIILQPIQGDLVIIIYAAQPAAIPVADRLANNVGNGQGLEDPAYAGAIGVLPVFPPLNLELVQVRTLGPEEMTPANFAGAQSGGDPEVAQLMTSLQQFLPMRLLLAVYQNPDGGEWNLMACEYGTTRQVMWIWYIITWTFGLDANGNLTVSGGVTALYFDDGTDRIVIFVKGPWLIITGCPSSEPLESMQTFCDALQI